MPRVRTLGRRHLPALVAVLALVVAVLTLPTASAVFTSTTANPANTLAADRLQPPSGLTATTSCGSSTIGFRAATSAKGSGSLLLPNPPGTSAGDQPGGRARRAGQQQGGRYRRAHAAGGVDLDPP